MRLNSKFLAAAFAGALTLPAAAGAQSQQPPGAQGGQRDTYGQYDSDTAGKKEMKGDQSAKSEQRFLVEAAMGNLAEANMGQLAIDRGQNEETKKIGRMLMQDHGKANDQLQQIFTQHNLAFPQKVDKAHTKTFTKLSEVKTAQFDAKFAEEQIKDHEKDLKLYQKWQQQALSDDVKQYIQQTIPVLEQHLQMAKDLQQTVKQTKTSS